MGPSGAGKTTLLASIVRKLQPGKLKRITGYVFANGEPYDTASFNQFGVFVM